MFIQVMMHMIQTTLLTAPMQHSTPMQTSPSARTLIYLTTFARTYAPQPDNEPMARWVAAQVAEKKNEGIN